MSKIETAGAGNYPARDGKPLYGAGRIRIIVRSNGSLEEVEIASSSGDEQLDRHMVSLVRGIEPLEEFSSAMRKRADRAVIETKFDFHNDKK